MNVFNHKIITLAIFAIFFSFLASGCARSTPNDIDPDTVAYLADYQNFDFGENAWIQAAIPTAEHLHLFVNEWNQSQMSAVNKLVTISLNEGTTEESTFFPLLLNEYVVGTAIGSNGNFLLLVNAWDDNGTSTYKLYEANSAGEKVGENDISQALGINDGEYLQSMYSNNKGELYFFVYSMSGLFRIIASDTELNLIGTVETTGYIGNLFAADNGDVYVTAYGDRGMGMVLKKVDFKNNSLGADIHLEPLSRSANITFASGGSTGILLNDGNNIYELDIENMVTNKILDYLESDIIVNDIRYFGQLDNGSYWLMNSLHYRDRSENELIVLNETTYGELPPREYLTYGSLNANHELKAAIINFNKTNQKYRIRIKEYAVGNDEDAYEAAMIKFNNDLVAGNIIDIIDLTDINFSRLAAKGTLLNLSTHIDRSKNINRNDYFENALNAYSIDGKLYGMMPSFSIMALVGHESKLNEIERWTVSEMIEWSQRYPDSKLMQTTSSMFINNMIYSVFNKFVDWDSGKCHFNSDDFIEILEYAAGFGEEQFDWNNPNRIGTHAGIRDAHYLLSEQNLNGLEYMQVINELFDGEPKFIGFPADKGSGILLQPSSAVGVSSRSKHKDGA
ncbi:MAG: extracellular solute-binding protein, partial [Lachnospiraceae bacterium]|nr:extracellular solute-binding protein [Lachnospiraceae bacterium]